MELGAAAAQTEQPEDDCDDDNDEEIIYKPKIDILDQIEKEKAGDTAIKAPTEEGKEPAAAEKDESSSEDDGP